MVVTPQLIKELREMTSAGMMDCKKALEATNGDIDEAVLWLRENGLAKAAKKADRVAAEGIVNAKIKNNKAIIFEVNSETDFVSKNEKFKNLINQISDALINSEAVNSEQALNVQLSSTQTIEQACIEATATIGEKIQLRRMIAIKGDKLSVYNHTNNRVSVALSFEGNIDDQDAYNLCMHVAAMSPKYIDPKDVPQDFKDQELHIIKETTEINEKQEPIKDKIYQNKLNKKVGEVCLLEQSFVLDESLTIRKFLESKKVTVKEMIRYEVGEGIEKATTDFASEVAAQLKGN